MIRVGDYIDGKFSIKKKIGSGACGSVWQAQDKQNMTNVAIKFINNIKGLHDTGFCHNDIKPDNILLLSSNFEKADSSFVTLCDFSASQQFEDNNHKHFELNISSEFNGNFAYSQSTKEDMISIFYLAIFLTEGNLPWFEKINFSSHHDAFKKIRDLKKTFHMQINRSVENCNILSYSFNLGVYRKLIKYLDSVEYDLRPDYSYLVEEIVQSLPNKSNDIDYIMDWSKTSSKWFYSLVQLQNKLTQNQVTSNYLDKSQTKHQKWLLKSSNLKDQSLTTLNTNKKSQIFLEENQQRNIQSFAGSAIQISSAKLNAQNLGVILVDNDKDFGSLVVKKQNCLKKDFALELIKKAQLTEDDKPIFNHQNEKDKQLIKLRFQSCLDRDQESGEFSHENFQNQFSKMLIIQDRNQFYHSDELIVEEDDSSEDEENDISPYIRKDSNIRRFSKLQNMVIEIDESEFYLDDIDEEMLTFQQKISTFESFNEKFEPHTNELSCLSKAI
ncbi:casein kinase i [Stylonychia lemnae]|uniref:Casein kinase I n=1 Tax=Stylonychia lemnae TaxID=5949 RepID=A0A078B833_STYLE|nr:casein kinase i [Stylonychia lemnae]|eukprot:CDW89437.1 casein kinase i [Stylonychia lemnae]